MPMAEIKGRLGGNLLNVLSVALVRRKMTCQLHPSLDHSTKQAAIQSNDQYHFDAC